MENYIWVIELEDRLEGDIGQAVDEEKHAISHYGFGEGRFGEIEKRHQIHLANLFLFSLVTFVHKFSYSKKRELYY